MAKKSKEYRANSRRILKEQKLERIMMERMEFQREKRVRSASPIKRLQRSDRPPTDLHGRGSPTEESFYQMREMYREGSPITRKRRLSPSPPRGYRGNVLHFDARGHQIEYQREKSREAVRMPVPYDHRFDGAPLDRHASPDAFRQRLRSPVGREGDPRYVDQMPRNGREKVYKKRSLSPVPALPPVSPVKLIYSAAETGRLLPPLSIRKAIIMGNQPKISFPPPAAHNDKKMERHSERKMPEFDDYAVNRKRERQFEDNPVRSTVTSRVISRPMPGHSPTRRMRPMEEEDRPPVEYVRRPPGPEFDHPRRIPLESPPRRIPLRESPPRRSPLRRSPPRMSPPRRSPPRMSPPREISPRSRPPRRSVSPPHPMFDDSPPRKRSWIDEAAMRSRPKVSPYREEERPPAPVEKRRGPPPNFERDLRLSRGRSPPMEFRRSMGRQWPEEHSPRRRRSEERSPRGRRPFEHSPRRRRSEERSPRGRRLEESIPRGHRPQEHIPHGRMPEHFIPRGPRPEEHIPRGRVPVEHFPRGRRPEEHIPRGRRPEEHIPRGRIPEEHFLRDRIPEVHFPRGRRPDENIPRGRRPEEFIPRGRRMEEDGMPRRRRPF